MPLTSVETVPMAPRLWTARRKREARLYDRLTKSGLLMPEVVELNRSLAEDIKYLRSHDLRTISFQTGNKNLTKVTVDHWLHQLEGAYLTVDAKIEEAKRDMRAQGIPIPGEIAQPPLAPPEEPEAKAEDS